MFLENGDLTMVFDGEGIYGLGVRGEEIISFPVGSTFYRGISLVFPAMTINEKMTCLKYPDNRIVIGLREKFLREYFFNFKIGGEICLLENQLDFSFEIGRDDEFIQGFPISPGFFLSFKPGLVKRMDTDILLEEECVIPLDNLNLEISGVSFKIFFSGDFNFQESKISIKNNNENMEIFAALSKRYLSRKDFFKMEMSLVFD